jgi:hypothetical protein
MAETTKIWIVARTRAHLHVRGVNAEGMGFGGYTGISVSLTKCRPSDELIEELGLPPLPKKGG